MASEKYTGEILTEQNALLRILDYRSVSGALDLLEKTYSSTKKSHPIVGSVCDLYERGARNFRSLAVCSIRPALYVLEPQLMAANSLACRGLDRLEEKIPALQYPPGELASNIKEQISSTLLNVKHGITSPVKQTSNAMLDKVFVKYQQCKKSLSYILNRVPAEQRANGALSMSESLSDNILPGSSAESGTGQSVAEQQPASESIPPHIFSRLSVLTRSVYRCVFEKTFKQFHSSRHQGHTLLTRIPAIMPLVKCTLSAMNTTAGVLLGLPSSVAAFLKDGQQHSLRQEVTHDHSKIPRRPSKLEKGSQTAENDGAKECLCGFLLSNIGDLVHIPIHNHEKTSIKFRESKEISEEMHQLRRRLIKQIPLQQKIVLGGRNKRVPSHRPSKKSLADHSHISNTSTYTRTAQNNRSRFLNSE